MTFRKTFLQNRITAQLLRHKEQELIAWMESPMYLSQSGERDFVLRAEQSVWRCVYAVCEEGGGLDVDLHVTFEIAQGALGSAACGLAVTFEQWSKENYVLLPGAVYAGNRFEVLRKNYPPLFDERKHLRTDLPITVTDIPHLSKAETKSRIEQTTGDLSVPGVGIYCPEEKKGVVLLTEQRNQYGNYGVFVEEDIESNAAVVRFISPCVRSERQGMCVKHRSCDNAANFKKGDRVPFHVKLVSFAAESVQDLFDRLFAVRKEMQLPSERIHDFPLVKAAELVEEKYNRENWHKDRGYYKVGTDDSSICFDWQLGWVGGAMVTHPLLCSENELSRKRAMRNLDTIITQTQAASGFFYGMGNARRFGFSGSQWWHDGFLKPHPYGLHLIRKNADALFWFVKQLMLIERQGFGDVPKSWKTAVRKLADAFVSLWKKYGQFGQFVDVETGELLVGGSSCAAIAPAGLVLSSRYFNNEEYLCVAEESADLYYKRDVRNGLTVGGPGEILQAPDSESSYAMLESFITLYEATRKAKWLDASEDMAKQFATWVVSYDYKFPADSIFGQLGIRTTGAVYANAQNKHAAAAICTDSGSALLRLYRATGNEAYLDLLRDIVHNMTQYVSRDDRPIAGHAHVFDAEKDRVSRKQVEMPAGYINERVNMSDWEGSEMIGEVYANSCWPEVSCLMAYREVPGLYVQPERGFVYAMDHVDVKDVLLKNERLQVCLHNPTKFDVKVRVLTETSEDANNPLAVNDMLDWPVVEIEAGASKTFMFTSDGKIGSVA